MIVFTETTTGFSSEVTGFMAKSPDTYSKVTEYVRNGTGILIKDEDGFDITRSSMISYSLGRLVQAHDIGKKEAIIDILSNVMSDELLETVVCCGGFSEYLNRKRKGLL